MAEENDKDEPENGGSIDYSGSQASIDKAKQKARDADYERLQKESE